MSALGRWWILVLAGCAGQDPPGRPSTDPSNPTTPTTPRPPLALASVAPNVVDPLGGSRLVVRGSGFVGPLVVTIGGAEAVVELVGDDELRLVSTQVAGVGLDLVVQRGADEAVLDGVIDAWSPAALPGAVVFDASMGLTLAEDDTAYEWQRLTPEIHPDWRARDGNTTTWLPATGKFWMVGGWNGYQEPDGFSPDPPGAWPPLDTTDEVWSSPDGVTWTLELPHGNGAFERRHSHNTVVWNGAMWTIGGDAHQGYYNHDVVTSADGVNWTVVLGPGTTDPPWSERAMQVSGVFDGRLWTVGGQDILGDPALYTYHNDVWVTDDGSNWTQVVPDGPASPTRWGGCGVLDGLVEFRGEMWLVGCAREREDAVGHSMSNEVWSTTDGATWQLHATPPWVGKIWPNVVVWDDKLWILFGYTHGDPGPGWPQPDWPAGNANEVWWSDDGETWNALPHDSPAPGSHAQGVAATEDFLLYAGGNYSFGVGDGYDKSAWRLVPFRGRRAQTWLDRGSRELEVYAGGNEGRPLLVPDAFGPDIPGLHFDGSDDLFALPAMEEQPGGRSVFWVARAPFVPMPSGWFETYAPLGTIVGGTYVSGLGNQQIGLSDGGIVVVNMEPGAGIYGEPLWSRPRGGSGLQEGPGERHFAGVTHATDGTMRLWVDGDEVGTAVADYGALRSWQELGGGLQGPYYGPNSRFAGTIGAVVIVPAVVDQATVTRIAAWAEGRFPPTR